MPPRSTESSARPQSSRHRDLGATRPEASVNRRAATSVSACGSAVSDLPRRPDTRSTPSSPRSPAGAPRSRWCFRSIPSDVASDAAVDAITRLRAPPEDGRRRRARSGSSGSRAPAGARRTVQPFRGGDRRDLGVEALSHIPGARDGADARRIAERAGRPRYLVHPVVVPGPGIAPATPRSRAGAGFPRARRPRLPRSSRTRTSPITLPTLLLPRPARSREPSSRSASAATRHAIGPRPGDSFSSIARPARPPRTCRHASRTAGCTR